MTEAKPKARGAIRLLWLVAGLLLTAVGIFGVVTPFFPGTVFLILAAGCFARSSERLERWLLNHPKLGPSVRAWRENGAIHRNAKILAISMMAVSLVIVCLTPAPRWVDVLVGVILAGCALFVGTRPGVPSGPSKAG